MKKSFLLLFQLFATMVMVSAQPAGRAAAQAGASEPIRQVERRVVVEEFTGTQCGWCPRGWVGMNMLAETFGDKCIGIALHNYNASDPMHNGNYATITAFTGAPAAVINREAAQVDPYMGLNNAPFGIKDLVESQLDVAPTVDVSITAEWTDEEHSRLHATATLEPLTSDETYTVAFVLTADSLKGSSSDWMQLNYYATQSASAAGYPDLSIFTPGGIYGQALCALTFNDVMIASSYYGNLNACRLPSGTQFIAGQPITISYDFNLASLVSAPVAEVLRKDLISAIVLIYNKKGSIANAARFPMQRLADNASLQAPHRPAAQPAVHYGLDGQRQNPSRRGLHLVRQADGTVSKRIY